MDFFAQQDRARASSRRLLVLYALALAGVLATLNLAGFWIWHASRGRGETLAGDAMFHAALSGAILLIVAIATAFKQGEIAGDGGNVAELLGGRLVSGTPEDLGERRLVNVVEEMSLASGVPLPRIYLLDAERAINAFAAGTRPENAVVAVTRGALDALSRDQLQGVVAHEFSHILNGDMRLNLRLIALNFGIMAVGYIGVQILRFSPDSSSGRRNNNKDNGAGAILLFAIAMIVIGYVGTLFGKMLQAAVSRQREYLADASAVQFTRNPDGIAGALKRIGGIGSTLRSPSAGEASHLFFADGVSGMLDALFATHPPLVRRIQAIDPSFDGKMTPPDAPTTFADEPALRGLAGHAAAADAPPILLEPEGSDGAGPPGDAAAARVSAAAWPIEPGRAAPLLASIPESIRVAVRDPFDARAVALALLLDRDAPVRARQLDAIAAIDDAAAGLADRYRPLVDGAGADARLPIAELALPALRSLSPTQRATFRQVCHTLAEADAMLSPFELALFKLIDHALPDAAAGDNGVRFASVSSVADEAAVLLSVLAVAGGPQQARAAFDAGVARLKPTRAMTFDASYDAAALSRALSTLRLASTVVRGRIVDAAATVVTVDGVVRPQEMELLRAACAAFDVPLPPIGPIS